MRLHWPLLMVALVLPTAGALVYFVAANPEDPLFRVGYTITKIVQFSLPVIALIAFDSRRLRTIRFSLHGVGVGAVLGVLTMVAIVGAYFLAFRDSAALDGLGSQVRAKVAGFGLDSPAGFVVLAVLLSIAHSFLEEYYWRWFVHAGLHARLPQSSSILISSLAFAAHHVVVLHVYFPDRLCTATIPFSLAVAFGGACWAWLYDRSASLAGPWVAHALTDAALMAVGFDLLYR
jgi:uncharacterized protein